MHKNYTINHKYFITKKYISKNRPNINPFFVVTLFEQTTTFICNMLSKKITLTEAAAVKKALEKCKNVVICTHTSPDGDAIGASLGLWHYLKSHGKNPTIIVPNYFPDFLKWMNGADKIIQFDRNRTIGKALINNADLICCLDFNALERIDDLNFPVKHSKAKK